MKTELEVWSGCVSAAALVVLAIGGGHLIEDYLYGVHTEFGLSEPVGLILAIVYYALFGTLIVLAARGKRAGFIGCLVMDAFLALADTTYHLDEVLFDWPYRNGWLSKSLEVLLIANSIVLVVVSAGVLRARKEKHH